jgi:uncharacterized protein YcaQ
MIREQLTAAQARRVALAAQGFGVPRPSGPVTMRQLGRVIDTIAVLQIDSVNVLARSHYLPVFSRLGRYPRPLLDRASSGAPRRLVEYWAHEASFVAPSTHRLLRWRMERAAHEAWGGMIRTARQRADLLNEVRTAVIDHGPLTAAALERLVGDERPRTRGGEWGWNWSDVKHCVEFLFWAGEITSAGRTAQFERRYAMPQQVLPAAVLTAPDPEPEHARRELVRIAAQSLGIATERCLRDYFRLRPAEARVAIADLLEAGELQAVTVPGWPRPGYLHRDARLPRRIHGAALLSPFDSLIWQRERTELLWEFRYRLEFYTPADRRVYGYYVLPFLLDERLVARVDLKADRRPGGGGSLLVRSAWVEPGADPGPTAEALADELRLMAGWLELDGVRVEAAGTLGAALATSVHR